MDQQDRAGQQPVTVQQLLESVDGSPPKAVGPDGAVYTLKPGTVVNVGDDLLPEHIDGVELGPDVMRALSALSAAAATAAPGGEQTPDPAIEEALAHEKALEEIEHTAWTLRVHHAGTAAQYRLIPLTDLGDAQRLPEFTKVDPSMDDPEAHTGGDDTRVITRFKDTDGRTMRVVVIDKTLAKLAVDLGAEL